MKNKVFIPVIVFLFCALNSCTQGKKDIKNWPQYLGPYRNSTSDQKGILRSWPEKGPEVLWTVDVGIGFGGPVIKDGKVYLLDRNGDVADVMRCFDFSSGKELWNYSYDAPGRVQFPGSRSVPAADGNYVYSCGHNGDLYCFDINTHKPVWHKNVWTDFGGQRLPTWAVTQCPLIYGNLLIIASQAPEAGVVGYDKFTGELKWKTPSIGPVGYVSPAIVKISGEDHVVMITAAEMVFPGGRPPREGRREERSGQGESSQARPPQSEQGQPPQGERRDGPPPQFRPTLINGKVVGINPITGEILWEYTNWQCTVPVPSAYDAGQNRVMIVGGYNAGAAMIKVDKKTDGTYEVTELYKNPDFGDHTKPPILADGYFYAQYSTNERRDGLVCMSIDGRIMWKTMRNPLFDKGSMILADGLILATDGRNTLYLIEPDSSRFKPLASADILSEGGTGSDNDPVASKVGGPTQNWAPLALADGKLLIRDQRQLMCVRVAR
ncbi:MAG TPA: PQQ-binding-like beta-propeller repeat protein [Bacteroidales bacterium]|nr:PQQ-binding-like beta-propeller repeat protein [Bacteroidales bacterium]HQG37298.1 PQQ-binding-like beta-propeller repeat protein [Bacteroidales bacterium]HQG52046.1 PQQ-binding-like beta-propeller repeat protein [Bacteroidales bacterium]